MFDWLNDIAGFFQVFWQFLQNTIGTVIRGATILITSLVLPQSIIPFMPAIIGSAILVFLVVGVIKFFWW